MMTGAVVGGVVTGALVGAVGLVVDGLATLGRVALRVVRLAADEETGAVMALDRATVPSAAAHAVSHERAKRLLGDAGDEQRSGGGSRGLFIRQVRPCVVDGRRPSDGRPRSVVEVSRTMNRCHKGGARFRG